MGRGIPALVCVQSACCKRLPLQPSSRRFFSAPCSVLSFRMWTQPQGTTGNQVHFFFPSSSKSSSLMIGQLYTDYIPAKHPFSVCFENNPTGATRVPSLVICMYYCGRNNARQEHPWSSGISRSHCDCTFTCLYVGLAWHGSRHATVFSCRLQGTGTQAKSASENPSWTKNMGVSQVEAPDR